MSPDTTWRDDYTHEMTRAHAARLAGNEGMARVCARRAAGIIVAEYLHRRGEEQFGPSALQRLRYIAAMPELAPRLKEIIDHFLLPVDVDHRLPDQIDLLSEAAWLAKTLLNEDELE